MYFCNPKPFQSMNMKNRFFALVILAVTVLSFVSCNKTDSIWVSSQDFLFDLEQGTDTLIVRANCKWSIHKNDDADWYTISPMSGKAKDSIVIISVNAYPDGDFRGSSFVVNSPGGHIRRTVFVSQNKLDFYGIVNKIFGVYSLEHWNVDFYGQILEETYKHKEYNPYDTTTGYLMYFLDDGRGYQRDHHKDSAVFYAFTYEYSPLDQNLHVEFETIDGSPESYDAQVTCASDSLYRVFHEFKRMQFERADHRKVGYIAPAEKAALEQKALKHKGIKRRGGEGIYQMD